MNQPLTLPPASVLAGGKKQLQADAAARAHAHLDEGGNVFEAVALARKLRVFADAFGEVAEAEAAKELSVVDDPVTAHGVTVEAIETVRYDYTASPAYNVLTQRIERLEAERKLVEERAKALAKKFRTDPQPEYWNDPETGESFEILPAARTAKPTLKCTLR